jgi:catechol 2,3-dioxygenase-like lactoylglutathione lyase family enzyme
MTTALAPGVRPRQKHRATALLLIATLLGLGILAFQTIDVSSEAEPTWIERELAFRLLQARIQVSGQMKSPPSTLDDGDIKRSSEQYEQRCASCHGSIRGGTAPFARTLSPRPPQFLTQSPRGSPAMDAYIIQHGIRWTGMPAFRSESVADAWRMALFLRRARTQDTRGKLAALTSDPLFGLKPYLVGLSVPNAQEAARWYREKLGFNQEGESTDRNGLHQIVVDRGAFAIELLEIKDSYSITKYDPGYTSSSLQLQGLAKMGFVVDDLDRVLRELNRREVRIVQGLTTLKAFQIRFLVIQDNNGNVIQIFDRKAVR